MAAKKNKDTQVVVRLEKADKSALEREAEKEGRSLAGQIRHILLNRHERKKT